MFGLGVGFEVDLDVGLAADLVVDLAAFLAVCLVWDFLVSLVDLVGLVCLLALVGFFVGLGFWFLPWFDFWLAAFVGLDLLACLDWIFASCAAF